MSTVANRPLRSYTEVAGLQPIRTVAQFLSISRSKVYQLMESGDLPYVKIGKSRRVRWPDVEKLVEQNTFGGSN